MIRRIAHRLERLESRSAARDVPPVSVRIRFVHPQHGLRGAVAGAGQARHKGRANARGAGIGARLAGTRSREIRATASYWLARIANGTNRR